MYDLQIYQKMLSLIDKKLGCQNAIANALIFLLPTTTAYPYLYYFSLISSSSSPTTFTTSDCLCISLMLLSHPALPLLSHFQHYFIHVSLSENNLLASPQQERLR